MGKISTAIRDALRREGCSIVSIDPLGTDEVVIDANRDGIRYTVAIKAEAGRSESTDEAMDAIDAIEEALGWLGDLPDAADDFAVSVGDKLASIQDWIEKNDTVTDNQLSAIENMREGIQKWIR